MTAFGVGELISIGTLLAFAIVCAAIPILRRRTRESVDDRPSGRVGFRTPFVPLTPLLGVVSCVILMFSLPTATWIRLIAWLALGLIVYAAFGYRHSKLRDIGPGDADLRQSDYPPLS